MAETVLGCELRVDGDIGLLEGPRCALLISRGERHPTPADARIQATIAATQQFVANRETLITGSGRREWDLALWTCRQAAGSAIIALDEWSEPPDFFPQNALSVWPRRLDQSLSKEARLLQRDRLIGLLATRATTIQIRASGNMARVASELVARGCPVDPWPSQPAPPVPKPSPVSTAINQKPETRNQKPFAKLTHFTREPDGLWPNEPYADYLRWLSSGHDFTPRDAFHALRRILAQRCIYGCGKLIQGSDEMVCLTQRDPAELLAENRWRKGLLRSTYSPYALTFERGDLTALGAHPVDYVSRDALQKASSADRRFMQVESSGEIHWRREEEWRVSGHLDFARLDRARLLAYVAHEHEAAAIEREFGVQALVLTPASF